MCGLYEVNYYHDLKRTCTVIQNLILQVKEFFFSFKTFDRVISCGEVFGKIEMTDVMFVAYFLKELEIVSFSLYQNNLFFTRSLIILLFVIL